MTEYERLQLEAAEEHVQRRRAERPLSDIVGDMEAVMRAREATLRLPRRELRRHAEEIDIPTRWWESTKTIRDRVERSMNYSPEGSAAAIFEALEGHVVGVRDVEVDEGEARVDVRLVLAWWARPFRWWLARKATAVLELEMPAGIVYTVR